MQIKHFVSNQNGVSFLKYHQFARTFGTQSYNNDSNLAFLLSLELFRVALTVSTDMNEYMAVTHLCMMLPTIPLQQPVSQTWIKPSLTLKGKIRFKLGFHVGEKVFNLGNIFKQLQFCHHTARSIYVCCYGASRHSSIVCHFSNKTSTSLIKEQKKTKLEAKKLGEKKLAKKLLGFFFFLFFIVFFPLKKRNFCTFISLKWW